MKVSKSHTQQPTITNEQVKEDIEFISNLDILNEDVHWLKVEDFNQFDNITQYISNQDTRIKELEDEVKCNLDLANDWSDKATQLQSKLDNIEKICQQHYENELYVDDYLTNIRNIIKGGNK